MQVAHNQTIPRIENQVRRSARSAAPNKLRGKAGSARGSGRFGSVDLERFLGAAVKSGPSGLAAHDLVAKGLGVADAVQVMKGFTIINEKQFYSVLGITARTLQRRAASAAKTLDANASDRALRLVNVARQATEVLGSLEAAERWLTSPAMGLDQRTPIDLLQSSEGTAMVKTLLSRMEYGVYA